MKDYIHEGPGAPPFIIVIRYNIQIAVWALFSAVCVLANAVRG
jgi:hypothetical protein